MAFQKKVKLTEEEIDNGVENEEQEIIHAVKEEGFTSDEKKIERMRQKDQTPVRGKFSFFEQPGGTLKFCYRKYKGDRVEKYELVDGQIYTLPLGVAKHLNSVSYPIHEFLLDEKGNRTAQVGRHVKRCGFESLDFTLTDNEIGTATDSDLIVEVKPI